MVMSEFTTLESNPGDLDWHAGSDTTRPPRTTYGSKAISPTYT